MMSGRFSNKKVECVDIECAWWDEVQEECVIQSLGFLTYLESLSLLDDPDDDDPGDSLEEQED